MARKPREMRRGLAPEGPNPPPLPCLELTNENALSAEQHLYPAGGVPRSPRTEGTGDPQPQEDPENQERGRGRPAKTLVQGQEPARSLYAC